jgi:hypothetical protein
MRPIACFFVHWEHSDARTTGRAVEQRKTAGNLQAYCKVPTVFVVLVPATNVLSNHLLEDLERLWQLRDIIPDPLNSEKTDTH